MTSAPTPSVYRPAVDGLRALAVLSVLFYHLKPDWWPSGYLGVDVFFVISGFVVTLSLESRSFDCWRLFLLHFYVRRVKRLLPALLVCVVVASFLAGLVMYPGSLERLLSLQTGFAALFGASNVFLLTQHSDYFGIAAELNLFLHTWSLGVESQFYLVYPLIWLLAAGRPRTLIPLLLLLTLGSWALQHWWLYQPDGFNAAFYLMPSRFWELGLGALVALLLSGLSDRPAAGRWYRPVQRVARWLGFPVLAALLWAVGAGASTHPLMAVPAAAGLTAALLMLLDTPGPLPWLLAHPWLVALGARSYGLYLWHWPLLVLLRWTLGVTAQGAVVVFGLSFGLAELSYRWVEQPWRRRSWRPRRGSELALGLGAASAAAASLVLLALPAGQAALWLGQRLRRGYVPPPPYPHLAYAPSVPGTPINRFDCFERFSFTADVTIRQWDLDRCRVAPRGGTGPTVFLYGDSYAGHLSPLMAEIRREYGVGLDVLIRARCPFPARQVNPADACYRFGLERRQHLLRTARAGDVLLIATSGREPGGRFSTDFLNALGELSRQLRQRGVRVVLQSPSPHFPGSFEPICVYPLQWFQPGADQRCAQVRYRARTAEQQRRMPLLNQLQPLVERDGLEIWDVFAVLCPEGSVACATHRGVMRLYRDDGHLSARGAALLASSLENLLFAQGSAGATRVFR